jgi:FkbM family methyltransferase
MKYYSQSNQDKWVCEYLKFKSNGYYLDIGAYDGIQTSNTFVLEKELNWSGICIEANPFVFKRLCENRNSLNINLAVTDYKGVCNFNEDSICNKNFGYQIECDTLNNILEKKCTTNKIDYLSIDIEGAEFDALKNFDFNNWQIDLITIEHNLYLNGPSNKNKLFELLSNNNFERVVEDALCLDEHPSVYKKPYEDWYINRKIL